MNIKEWEVSSLNKDRAATMAEQYGIPFFLAMLLDIHGFVSEAQIREVLEGGTELSNPFLMKDMDKAVARIRRAVDNFEKIAVYGDYDADGVTSTAMLYTYLDAQGADVVYYIPQREGEGYGMNPGAVNSLSKDGVTLIITVDNGISSVEEVRLAGELGIDVVVTDHHRPQEHLPEAVAVVDAYQADDESPFKDFSGAGVTLKLLMALEDGDADGVLLEYADLAALGTIGDVVPVLGENRTIIKTGLELLSQGGRPGVDALLASCSNGGRGLTSTSLAFTAIPRINATGRMGSPERAVQLLIGESQEDIDRLAEEICGDNEERRRVEAEITKEAIESLEKSPEILLDRVLIVSGENWHHGVIGIVAARITERFGKPCFVISQDGEAAKGSGRSVEGFSLFEAVSACGDVLEKFGGHPMAAGVNLKAEKIEAFRKKINEYAKSRFPEMPVPRVSLDCKLNPASLSPQMPEQMGLLEPFGTGNSQPLFGLYAMELEAISPVGNGNHLRLTLKKKDARITCMRFGVGEDSFPYRPGDVVDLAVLLDAREFRGEQQLTVNIREIKLSALDVPGNIMALQSYEKYRRREKLHPAESAALLPNREDLAVVYRALGKKKEAAFWLQPFLCSLEQPRFNLGKLEICFEILKERGLVSMEGEGERRTAKLPRMSGKVDVFASPIFGVLKELSEGN